MTFSNKEVSNKLAEIIRKGTLTIFQRGTTNQTGIGATINVNTPQGRVQAYSYNVVQPGEVTVFYDTTNRRYVAWQQTQDDPSVPSNGGKLIQRTELQFRKTRPREDKKLKYPFFAVYLDQPTLGNWDVYVAGDRRSRIIETISLSDIYDFNNYPKIITAVNKTNKTNNNAYLVLQDANNSKFYINSDFENVITKPLGGLPSTSNSDYIIRSDRLSERIDPDYSARQEFTYPGGSFFNAFRTDYPFPTPEYFSDILVSWVWVNARFRTGSLSTSNNFPTSTGSMSTNYSESYNTFTYNHENTYISTISATSTESATISSTQSTAGNPVQTGEASRSLNTVRIGTLNTATGISLRSDYSETINTTQSKRREPGGIYDVENNFMGSSSDITNNYSSSQTITRDSSIILYDSSMITVYYDEGSSDGSSTYTGYEFKQLIFGATSIELYGPSYEFTDSFPQTSNTIREIGYKIIIKNNTLEIPSESIFFINENYQLESDVIENPESLVGRVIPFAINDLLVDQITIIDYDNTMVDVFLYIENSSKWVKCEGIYLSTADTSEVQITKFIEFLNFYPTINAIAISKNNYTRFVATLLVYPSDCGIWGNAVNVYDYKGKIRVSISDNGIVGKDLNKDQKILYAYVFEYDEESQKFIEIGIKSGSYIGFKIPPIEEENIYYLDPAVLHVLYYG